MAPRSPDVARERARIAGLIGGGKRSGDDPVVIAARRDLEAAKLAEHIERVVAAMPPLTPAQRMKLAELLKPVRVPAGGGST
jgi:hypothetical protein